ncbi:DUF305 domain-containing protein [Phaeovulum sp.]|uniref:DUF305 domain-containing protein n=1 Tax=Phaeovulum sp. TaxID=2934796 RepID=UPI0027303D86|nr:DUF305 domain-containing protein [Phaeovulum sp.]MDP1669797.1 DUF305 domain-containing protein [Phaeovulum sp.]MDZ4119366.1 DUF305 domain-containing protein [Phaeovulum sp.]
MKYARFFAMIATSTVIMFALMYLNTYLVSHVFWSETRAYMAMLMGAAMAIVMLGFMLSMYSSKSTNTAIFAGAVVVFGGALWLVRSQVTVGDVSYMRAMVPNHSTAIMTSTRAGITDPRVRKLADGIIYAQDKEIAEMRYLLDEIGKSGKAAAMADPAPAQIVSLTQALSTAETASLAPQFLSEDDIARLFPTGPVCRFSDTPDSRPVLVTGTSGDLVQLDGEDEAHFATDGVRLSIVAPDGWPTAASADAVGATLTMELAGAQTAGYRGYFDCPPK